MALWHSIWPVQGKTQHILLPRYVQFSMPYTLQNTVQFRSNQQSRVTHPPVDHELWSMSRVTRASVEPPSGHTGPKLPKKKKKKREKGKISGSNAEIFEVSRKKSAAAEMSNR
jgi:hypothetical protein